jgi:1-acyl-sn-glycerol-3-phosphate acyltransferase
LALYASSDVPFSTADVILKVVRYIRDWVFSIPTLLAFGLSLAFFDIVGRIALLFGRRPFEWTMAALQKCLLWSFLPSNVRVNVERSAEMADDTPYILVSNHQAMLDVPIFGGLLIRSFPKYVAKKELGRWIPSVSLNLKRGGNALIDRDDRRQAFAAIRKLASESQERGTSIVMFPEGRRSRDGETLDFQPGGLAMVLRSAPDMAVVPTVIDGSWKVFLHNMFPVPFGTKVRIRFGTPIERSADLDAAAIMATVEEFIADTLAEWRA